MFHRVGSVSGAVARLGLRLGCCVTMGACGSGSSAPDSDPQPVDPATLPASCGTELEVASSPARASSLRLGSCDFGETADHTAYDLLCAPGVACDPPQQAGDQLCHRLCDDGQCAAGETCQERTVYVSDTPSHTAMLCMCDSGNCAENPERESNTEAGLAAWRAETPMPVELYYHAMAASDRQLFVSGGLNIVERGPNGSASGQMMDALYVADLDEDGAILGWQEPLHLAAPILHHAMAVVGERLYVAGGEVRANDGPSTFTAAVVSYPLAADGSLGEPRDERSLPEPRGWHTLLVDTTSGAEPRLIVASGALDSSFFSDGTSRISFTDVGADGALGTWASVEAPDALYFSGGATIAAGSLYGFVTGEYFDRSSRALYGIPLSDLAPGATPAAFVNNSAWPFDPAALSAFEDVQLAGLCAQLVVVGPGGAVGTAPVDAAARTGAFRAAARFFGAINGSALAMAPSGRIYVSGGSGSFEDGVAIRSTTAQSE